ncbi:ParB/RepB/Spo0J family partition protein [bacterium]|nr:ParB/RepB/Spo0J family partition protein [bacterium]
MLQRKNTLSHMGKGIDALLGADSDQMMLPISSIRPNEGQPRKRFDEKRLEELAESIRQYGIIQPIVVKKEGAFYRIVAGERRFRAAQMAGLTQVPVTIFKGEEDYQVSLIENLQREDLNPIEIAEAYNELMKRFGYTQEELSQKVGKSRSEVSNCMRLLNLCGKIQDLVRSGELSIGQVRPLAALTHKEQELLLDRILNEKLSARQVEKLATSKAASKALPKTEIAEIWKEKAKDIARGINATVRLKPKKRGIAVTLNFASLDDFDAFSKFFKNKK